MSEHAHRNALDVANDQLVVASTGQDLIKSFTDGGTQANFLWKSPTGVSLGINAPRDAGRGPDGRIWVSDYANHFVKAFDLPPTGPWTSTTPAITLGGNGTGNGQINFPYNVDFNLAGTQVYVSDTGNNRVAVWDLTTTPPTFVQNFGGNCPVRPNPCLDPPDDFGYIDTLRRVVVAEDGTVITADFWGNGLQTWTAGGVPVGQIELRAAPAPGFAQAFGVATAPNGDVYVMDRLNQRLQRFNSAGQFLAQAGSRGTQPGKFSWPEAVAVAPDGSVWAADTRGDRIQRWPASLSPIPGSTAMYGTSGAFTGTTNPGRFNYIEDLDVSPTGLVYVADTNNNRIQVVTPGTLPSNSTAIAFGLLGSGNGQFNHPQGIAVSATNIFVADTDNNRIQKLDLNGAWVATYGGVEGSGPGQLDHPQGVALGPDGSVWVADTDNNRILHLSASLTDLGDGFGSAGSGNMQFDLPHSLAVAGPKLYVADTFNDRVQIFDTGSGGGPDTTAPGMTFSVPTEGQVFPPGQINLSGTATDNVGVTVVRVAIQDRNKPAGQNWWRVGGTWGAFQNQTTTLGTPGGTSTAWSFAWTPPASGSGSYRVQGEALDAATNVTPAPKPARLFSVSTGGGPDTTAPTPVITAPTASQVLPNGPVTFGGTATDNVGVTIVRLAIKDLARPAGQNWWRVGGTWGAFQNQTTTLGTPGGTSTTWSYNWTPPTTAGSYSIQVEALDAANNVTPAPKPVRQFSVLAAGGSTLNPTYNRQVSNPGGIAPLYPAGGATDPSNGDRYIADSGGSRIVKISAGGTQSEVSPLAAGWNDPRDLEFDVSDPDSLWVADTSDSQIVKMSRAGAILQTFGGAGVFLTPYGLANDASGVYVADTYNNRVQKINKTTGAVIWTQTTCSSVTFSRPRDVTVGSDGNVYVADTDRNRIVRLDPTTGACQGTPPTFGTTGGGNAQFRSPRALTSDGAGGLWIADAGNNRVKHQTNGGTFIGQAGTFGQGVGVPQFRSAHCVFLDGNRVNVCDTFNYRIHQFSVNPSGAPFWSATIGGTRPANGGFNGAFDVAYAPDGSMYAVDWFNHRIQKFDAAGNFLLEFGGYASNDGSLIFPRGVVVAPNGNVVVMDSENNRIDVFSSGGAFIQKIKPPTGQTQFLRPHQVAIAPDGTYWVADTGNNRVVHISASGCPNACTVLHTWNASGTLNQPRGIAVDASGLVYVSTGGNHRVRKFSVTGAQQGVDLATQGSGPTNVQGPYGLRIVGIGANAMLLIADAGNNRIVAMTLTGTAISTFGTVGSGNGQFSSPRGMDRNPLTGEIAVADFLNNRLSIWTT